MTYGLRDLDGRRVELCDECGFDEREPRDLPAAFAEVYASLERLHRHPEAGRRPEPETWSGKEYAEHCVDGTDQKRLKRPVAGASARLGTGRQLTWRSDSSD